MLSLIRELRTEDSGLFKEFLASLSPKTIRSFSFHPLPEDYGDNFLKRKDIACFVAEIEGKIVGYTWWEPSSAPIPTIGICVRDEYQGNGIGKSLLSKLIEEAKARGKSGLRLTVSKENEIALSLYRKAGFQIIGEYRDSKGINYIMKLSFSP